MDCLYCGKTKTLRVEKAMEVNRFLKRIRKVTIYYCMNPECNALPYFYRERKVEIDSYDLKEVREK